MADESSLAPARAPAEGSSRHRPMRIAMTGASGFIGRALTRSLEADGHTVLPVSRSAGAGRAIQWDPERGRLDPRALEGIDAAINLAGENIGQRWTPEVKRRIRDSRVRGTELLATTLARLERPPSVLVSASAVGIYGDRGDEILKEDSPPGRDFLAGVVTEWEDVAEPAREAGIRVVHPRQGVVLAPDGGALKRLLLPFRLGIGGRIGSGMQWMSWIDRRDLVSLIGYLLVSDLEGAVNAVSPQPVRNAEFSSTLGRVLGRPAVIPTPVLLMKLLFGEMAEATLLAGQRAMPNRLLGGGFEFRHPRLDTALVEMLR
jgi:uncharacterized protein (TIGR01777 family)